MATTETNPDGTNVTDQRYQIFVGATPDAIWKAVTEPDLTAQYFHGARIGRDGDRWMSHGPDGGVWGDEELIGWDPPWRLVHGWRSLYAPELEGEPSSRVTWAIDETQPGVCMLTLVHDRLEQSPKTAAHVGGAGWMHVLSNLKTFVETGRPM